MSHVILGHLEGRLFEKCNITCVTWFFSRPMTHFWWIMFVTLVVVTLLLHYCNIILLHYSPKMSHVATEESVMSHMWFKQAEMGRLQVSMCVCVCVHLCVCARTHTPKWVCVCVCVWLWVSHKQTSHVPSMNEVCDIQIQISSCIYRHTWFKC